MSVKILVVDDDAAFRTVFEILLKGAGYEVEVASDGMEGLRKLTLDKYDLVLTDNDMPNLTGLEMVSLMRDARLNSPVILMSGNVVSINKDRATSLGISAVMEKTSGAHRLLEIIRTVLLDPNG